MRWRRPRWPEAGRRHCGGCVAPALEGGSTEAREVESDGEVTWIGAVVLPCCGVREGELLGEGGDGRRLGGAPPLKAAGTRGGGEASWIGAAVLHCCGGARGRGAGGCGRWPQVWRRAAAGGRRHARWRPRGDGAGRGLFWSAAVGGDRRGAGRRLGGQWTQAWATIGRLT